MHGGALHHDEKQSFAGALSHGVLLAIALKR